MTEFPLPEYDTPFGLTPGAKDKYGYSRWSGRLVSVDGTETGVITLEDVEEVLYWGTTDPDDWDGHRGAVVRLKDGRLVAWHSWWGPTGSGFSEDAYGGDADVYFGRDLSLLVKAALDDAGRRLLNIDEKLWA